MTGFGAMATYVRPFSEGLVSAGSLTGSHAESRQQRILASSHPRILASSHPCILASLHPCILASLHPPPPCLAFAHEADVNFCLYPRRPPLLPAGGVARR